ncbi:hypothetical protein EB796_000231 [Bugula neritina]|uniref:Uncharacterized protein n=1 Tax=Bugula neritina TaxID=10212 RepID=A0A7J7KTS7_BUGNE|nr:hypothetical protein EB796_000231 [Bugula neritina]
MEYEASDVSTLDLVTTMMSSQSPCNLIHSIAECTEELKKLLSTKQDVSALCRCLHKSKGRMAIFQEHVTSTLSLSAEGTEATSKLQNVIQQAECYLLQSETFMSYVVTSIGTPNSSPMLSLVSQSIFSYLQHTGIRKLLLSSNLSDVKWTEEQTNTLLLTLESLYKESSVQEVMSDETHRTLKQDLSRILLKSLNQLNKDSYILKFPYLNEFSSYFDSEVCRQLMNLSLNTIRPQYEQVESSSAQTLTALLAVNPKDVIKIFTHQLLKSKSALASVLAKVYMVVMETSMIPTEVYIPILMELSLSEQQTDDLVSKCLIGCLQTDCPVSHHIINLSYSRMSLDNRNLSEMLKNVECALAYGSSVIVCRLHMDVMNAIALFLISVMDSGSAESTQTLTVTLSSKIISSSHLQHALQELQETTLFWRFTESLHPETIAYLKQEHCLSSLN